jgi:hypothetical protein
MLEFQGFGTMVYILPSGPNTEHPKAAWEANRTNNSTPRGQRLLPLLDNYLARWPDAPASLFCRDGTATRPPSSIESHNQNHPYFLHGRRSFSPQLRMMELCHLRT